MSTRTDHGVTADDAGRADDVASARWRDAVTAAALCAVDPVGLKGIVVRAGAGPVRERWLACLRTALPEDTPLRRMPAQIEDANLLGGLDLAATLDQGRPVVSRGLLATTHGGVLVLSMAERLPAGTAGRLAAVLDSGRVVAERDGLGLVAPAELALVALDEGAEPDEHPPLALSSRLALHIDLTPLSLRDAGPQGIATAAIGRARALLARVEADPAVLEALCTAALGLGITCLRAPLLALRCARAAAALAGRAWVSEEDAALAARLVLAPRATAFPAAAQAQAPDEAQDPASAEPDAPPTDPSTERSDDTDPQTSAPEAPPLEDVVLAAAAAALPADLLARLAQGRAGTVRAGSSGRTGAAADGKGRGRPVGLRQGLPRPGLKLDLIATLRAAAPWQRLRLADGHRGGDGPLVKVRRDDIRVAKLKRPRRTTTIFAVDASGSAAFRRLAEAKGAVELLLADCYVRRDQVALIAFRGTEAQAVLAPTRSLVRARRCLADMVGGGPTPLAAGLEVAGALALAERRRGTVPKLVVLTDGRGNVARDGTKGRVRGAEDALAAARAVRGTGIPALLVDTSTFPEPEAKRVAEALGALYVPLPSADATALSRLVRADAGRG